MKIEILGGGCSKCIEVKKSGLQAVSELDINADIEIATVDGAQSAIATIDVALEQINATRSDIGAVANRLEFTISNLMIS